MSVLPLETFKAIVEHAPLVSIDLIVKNKSGQVLLGKRSNRPAKGFWFVPGGRILKDEHFDQAFSRLTETELGKVYVIENAVFLGFFEHHYPDNFSGESFSTHYIVLAFEIVVDVHLNQLPNQQHSEYKWFSETELLDSADVHRHTQWYFQANRQLTLKHRM